MMTATTTIIALATAATTGLVATQIPGTDQIITLGERVDRMSVVSVLAIGLILCLAAIGWMARRWVADYEGLMRQAILAANNAVAGAQRLESASVELKQATLVLAEITAYCRVTHEKEGG